MIAKQSGGACIVCKMHVSLPHSLLDVLLHCVQPSTLMA